MRLVDHLDTIKRVFLAANSLLTVWDGTGLLINMDWAGEAVRAWLL